MINMPGGGRLVVGVSGSPGSLCAFRYALCVAHTYGVPLVAVLAWVPPGGNMAERRFPSPELRRLWADAAGNKLADALNAACGALPDSLAIRRVIVRGETGPALVNIAEARDLLVLGGGRRGAWSRLHHGQIVRYCLAHARCPVLTVPHPATARQLGLGPGVWAARRRELYLNRALRDWDSAG